MYRVESTLYLLLLIYRIQKQMLLVSANMVQRCQVFRLYFEQHQQ